jgi:hypothetical protein
LQPVLWKYLPSLCEWFVKLFGLVFDAYHSLFSLLELENLFRNVKIALSSCLFCQDNLGIFSFSLSLFGFFSAFYYTPWMLVGFSILY